MARGHHALSVEMFRREAAFWARLYAKDRNPSRNRYKLRKLERCRENEQWHLERVRLGVVDPPEVAALAAIAENLSDAARRATSYAERKELLKQFTAAVRAAGQALRIYRSQNPDTEGQSDRQDFEAPTLQLGSVRTLLGLDHTRAE
jgi:hypothetical protein